MDLYLYLYKPVFGCLNVKSGFGFAMSYLFWKCTTYGVSKWANGCLSLSLSCLTSLYNLEECIGAIYEVYDCGMLIPSSSKFVKQNSQKLLYYNTHLIYMILFI